MKGPNPARAVSSVENDTIVVVRPWKFSAATTIVARSAGTPFTSYAHLRATLMPLPVQHPGRVCGAQCAQQVDADPRGLRRVHRPVGGHPLGEGRSVDQLQDDVRAFVVLDDVVHDDDVRVAELGQGARLAQGAFPLPAGVGRGERVVEGQFLHRDAPAEQLVRGPPHHAHTATPE
ncbi:hypothetical protein STENM223S_00953 [Streptomyces tendae]